MASELKPWKYDIQYGPEGEANYAWVYDDQGVTAATMKTHKAKQIVDAMNTRPAPAATDTGLETVEHQAFIAGDWVSVSPEYNSFRHGHRELVTRSQAEELSAAKDAENAYLKELVAARGETIKRGDDRIRKLEADNAAQAARIKELDRCHEGTIDLCNQKTAQIEALEAKLEAAEQRAEKAEAALDRSKRNHRAAYDKGREYLEQLSRLETELEDADHLLEEAKASRDLYADFSQHWRAAAFKKRDECDELRKEKEQIEAEAERWKQAFAAQSYKLSAALLSGDERVREAVRRAAEEVGHGC